MYRLYREIIIYNIGYYRKIIYRPTNAGGSGLPEQEHTAKCTSSLHPQSSSGLY